jgi:mannosyltransferase OCH1-like enzyme
MAIPRRVILSHESAYTLGKTPSICKATIDNWLRDFEILFFSANERRTFVRQHAPGFLDLYDSYPRNIHRSDLFRVLAIYLLGGFYLDLDMFMHGTILIPRHIGLVITEEFCMSEAHFEQRYFRRNENAEELIQIGNYAFGAVKGHRFLDQVLTEMVERSDMNYTPSQQPTDVLHSTGPDVFSAVFHAGDYANGADVLVLRGGKHGRWCQFGDFGSHMMAGTWYG